MAEDHLVFKQQKWYPGKTRDYIGYYATSKGTITNYVPESGGFGPGTDHEHVSFGSSEIIGQFNISDGTIMLHVAWIGRGHNGQDPYGDWFKLTDLNIIDD